MHTTHYHILNTTTNYTRRNKTHYSYYLLHTTQYLTLLHTQVVVGLWVQDIQFWNHNLGFRSCHLCSSACSQHSAANIGLIVSNVSSGNKCDAARGQRNTTVYAKSSAFYQIIDKSFHQIIDLSNSARDVNRTDLEGVALGPS